MCYLNGSDTGLESTCQTPSSQVPPASSSLEGGEEGWGRAVWASEQGSEDEGLREQSGHLGPWFPSRVGRWEASTLKPGSFVCCEVASLEYSFFHWLVLKFVFGGRLR